MAGLRSVLTLALSLSLLSSWAEAQSTALDGPLSAERAPASFRLEPGLRMELVASEPMVVSPVAVAFDERGRLFVAENRGYPTGPGEGKPPAGRVALLEDRDGDGKMDARTEFAEGLTFPNGLMPWNGGLIVTCAPEVLFLRDNDGDGKADERTVLFDGFDTEGSTQLRVSHPTLSIDGWVYLTSGLRGGRVTSPRSPGRAPVVLNREDFRFRPGGEGDVYEAANGGAQFGTTFDDFGHRFICYNRVQVQHVVMDSRVLKRNPLLAFSDTVQNCPSETVPEPLRGHGAGARIFPLSRNVTTADSHAGTFTAACAVTVYRGDGLPDRYRGGAFSCDPTGNLVHVDRLEPQGATFAAVRMSPGVEFLASTDSWFRPVYLAHGPEGALYICDMYRKTIEHPDYLPVEVRKRTDFDGGKTMGRIWRVVRDGAPAEALKKSRQVDLTRATNAELAAMLRDPNAWRVDTAFRLLLARRDAEAAGSLRAIVNDPEAAGAPVVRALRLLESLGKLDDDMLQIALRHREAGAREQGLLMVEPRLNGDSGWIGRVLAMAGDPDARVRFQVACSLGTVRGHDAECALALSKIAARDGADRWLRAAALSSIVGREDGFLAGLRGQASLDPDLLTEFGRLLGAGTKPEAWPGAVRRIFATNPGFTSSQQAALVTGCAEGARGRATGDVLTALAGGDREAADALGTLVKEMTRLSMDAEAATAQRTSAIGLLAFASLDQVGAPLLKLISPDQPGAIQAAAARAYGAHRDERVAGELLSSSRFAAYAPNLRDEVLSALVGQSSHLPGLLSALEQGSIPIGAIDVSRRRQLTQSRDAEIRRRAEAIFGAVAGDRAKVYEAYKDVVDMKPDAPHGRVVFQRECASCHRLDQEGHAVGPDLFGVRNQPKLALLLHILAPDQEITQGFAAYTVATKDGRVLTGLIASETPTSVTLRQQLGKEDVILRSEIDELSAGKQSLMPQGVEKNITRQEFADLLAYLKGEAAGQ